MIFLGCTPRYDSIVNRDDSLPNGTARHKSVQFRRIRHLMLTLKVRLHRLGGFGRTWYDSVRLTTQRYDSTQIGADRKNATCHGNTTRPVLAARTRYD